MTRHSVDAQKHRTHQQAWDLLPWYVNGTLTDHERRDIEAHLVTCRTCQAALEQCHALAEAVHADEDVTWSPAPDRVSRLLSRIDAAEARDPRASHWWQRVRDWCMGARSWWQHTPSGVRWAIAAQGVLILLLASTIGWQSMMSPASFYRTLADVSTPIPGQAQIRVVFADDMTAWEIRELLTDIGGTIVKGPSPLGAYLVEVLPAADGQDHLGQVLDAVRAHRKVRLAEPVVAR
jgi:hypothetical protein